MTTVVSFPDKYKCDICKTEYSHIEMAEFCETHKPLPATDFKINDEVLVSTRYCGWKKDIITNIEIGPTGIVEQCEDLKQFNRIKENNLNFYTHQWVVTTSKEWLIYNDGTTTNKWNVPERAIIPYSSIEWKTEFPKEVDSNASLLMESTYSGGKTEIRNGSVEWWENYHSDCELIRWALHPLYS